MMLMNMMKNDTYIRAAPLSDQDTICWLNAFHTQRTVQI